MKFKSLELHFEVYEKQNQWFSKKYIVEVKSDDFLDAKKQIKEQVSAILKEVFLLKEVRIIANIRLENDLASLHKQIYVAKYIHYTRDDNPEKEEINFETAFMLGECMKNFNYENLSSVFEGISLKNDYVTKQDDLGENNECSRIN